MSPWQVWAGRVTTHFWLQGCVLSSEDMRQPLTGGRMKKRKRPREAHLSACSPGFQARSPSRGGRSASPITARRNCPSVSTSQKGSSHLVTFVLVLLRFLLMSGLHVLRASECVFFFFNCLFKANSSCKLKTNKQKKPEY